MRYHKYLILVCALTFCACSDDSVNSSQVPETPGTSEPPGNPPVQQPECQNPCSEGEKLCDGNTSMVCVDTNDDGCFEWVPKECNDDENCSAGVCMKKDEPTPSCTNECDAEDDQICTEQDGISGYKRCANFDDDVCFEWSSFTPCPDGTTCTNGACGGCTNECSENGAAECSGDGYRTCVDANGDGCFEWSDVTPCEHGCENNHCACAHECEAEQKECTDEGYRTCTTDTAGCRIWSQVTVCEHGCSEGNCKEAPKIEPTRYPGDKILSPVTPYVVQSMKNIAAKGASQNNDVFIKVGDSHMADDAVFMRCFAKSKTPKPNLNGANFLQSVIDEFQKTKDSFNRDSISTEIGRTAWWANKYGKLTDEMNAMHPRFAFYGYGSNDMEWHEYEIADYFWTLEWFYQEVKKGMNTMMNSGIIPLLIGTGVRTDKPATKKGMSDGNNPFYLVPVFDAVSRGLAEQYQVPYMNLQLGQQPLKDNNYGLGGDGLHHKDYNGGCDFSDSAMIKYGANMRNRHAIEMLDRAWKALYQSEAAPDTAIPFQGSGTAEDPYIIDSLPYTHAGNTKNGKNIISQYPACRDTNEGGPEIYYKLVLTQKTKFRAFAVSSTDVDADIHILNSTKADGCMKAANRYVEGNFDPGTYYFSVDSFKNENNAGEYLFGIVPCLEGDPICGKSLTGG